MYPLTQMRSPSFNPNIYIERMTLKTAPGTNTKNLNNEGVQKWAIINGLSVKYPFLISAETYSSS